MLPDGYAQTVGAGGITITGVDQTGMDFANFELFDISGTKWKDITGDGITADDTGLAGVTVFIDKNGNGTYDAGTDQTTTTGSDGTWSFPDLSYDMIGKKVYEVLPDGYAQTVGAGGITITGVDQTGMDFANFELFDISGHKYRDMTMNGITADDTGLGGVTIFIDKNGNGTYDAGTDQSTVTASDGAWSFSGLDQTYIGKNVYEVVPSGYTQTVGANGIGITGVDQTGMDFANWLTENGRAQTPGFWKNWPDKFNQETHDEFVAAGHPELTMTTAGGYETYFDVNALGTKTVSFAGALGATGGGENAFLRASAASFANAATNEINYQIDESQIASQYLNILYGIDSNDDDHIEVAEIKALVSDMYSPGGSWAPATANFTAAAAALDAMNNMIHLDSSVII